MMKVYFFSYSFLSTGNYLIYILQQEFKSKFNENMVPVSGAIFSCKRCGQVIQYKLTSSY